MPHVDRTVFQFSFCNSPEHAMPLSHRCCISSSSVFVAPLSVEVIRANCNLKHAVTVWHLLAHGVGGIFSLQPCFSDTTRSWRDYDGIRILMTRLWRDCDAIRITMTRLQLAYSPIQYLVVRFTAKEFHGSIVGFLGDWTCRTNDEVCDQDLSARICACKYVQMRANARVALIDSLTWTQNLSAGSPSRSRRKHGLW